MIKVDCDACGNELEEKGAILWSPPNKKSMCKKYHLCVFCFKCLLNKIENFVHRNDKQKKFEMYGCYYIFHQNQGGWHSVSKSEYDLYNCYKEK